MDTRFECELEEREKVIIFKLRGNLDVGTVSGIMTHDDSRLSKNDPQKFLFDCSDLEHIDSSGVGAIIVLFKRVRSNKGDVKISHLRGQPKDIFDLLRLDRVFEIYDDLDKAIESFR
jgi:anti-sigma B factor antagonist